MRVYIAIGSVCLLATFVGCGSDPKSAKGFSLPDGDPEAGQALFVDMKCHACHPVSGLELPAPSDEAQVSVVLGGEAPRIKTYGELVTSIINPSHRLAKGYPPEMVQTDGQSKMTNYNDVMTVSQLIDLVAFLQSHYQIMEYEPTDYPVYFP